MFCNYHDAWCQTVRLRTAWQADSDHHVKDTYNYVTVQADIRMPGRHLAALEGDQPQHEAWERAIRAAIVRVRADDRDVRVLNLGCGTGAPHGPGWSP
jgi:protein arginine N-methyltransferase 7